MLPNHVHYPSIHHSKHIIPDTHMLWLDHLPCRVLQAKASNKNCVTIVSRLPVKNTEIWFLRVSLDRMKKNMALGNLVGKIYLWDLDVDDHRKIRWAYS